MARKLRYRLEVESEHVDGVVMDVFDGTRYRELRETQVSEDDQYKFFDNPEDIALGLSTDGFTLFKQRRRGHSTAWPIILINYNLSPKIRTQLENVMCVGIIPGPQQCKDISSFLVPLMEELLELEGGIVTSGLSPDGSRYLLLLKGHNAFSPCRTCYVEGCKHPSNRVTVYYIPLVRPNEAAEWDCNQLPIRTHARFLEDIQNIEGATGWTLAQLTKHYGINGRSIFSHLKSIDLTCCAPYDIMHLFFENVVPNLILHWIGEFKGLDKGSGNYQIDEATWKKIGQETADAVPIIPSAFVGTLPDIAQDRILYKAEVYSFWIQYVAPIVLAGRLRTRYYKHVLLFCEIIMLCLEFSVTDSDIDRLDNMVKTWVTQYEQYYYQYSADRISACTLTIHALLHLPYYLRKTGPLWASWAFVMERFCGHLLPAVKNRIRPYDHLDNYVQRRAQMRVVSLVHNLPELSRSHAAKRRTANGIEISTREVAYPEFPDIVLGTPVTKKITMTVRLQTRFTRYFGVVYAGRSAQYLRNHIDESSIIRYGRFRIVPDGDRIRTASLIRNDRTARDNSFVRYQLLPDANAAFRNRPDVPRREVQYGKLLDLYYVVYVEHDGKRVPYILAHIEPCETHGLDATQPQTPVVSYNRMLPSHIVHIQTIESVVGRIKQDSGWAIVDRSRSGARTEFVDENGDDFD
ncbi:hypothetical protein CTheo_5234 [Ceratobasidium theobromae]|uniref:Transposase family Tnp2 protein n=1 Tax=Ceratobasidium theobromae TaxID=1582974 RepID=A0A5N5QIK4_9AGAM|nr:hypothetical protein CTheo_5234 [Ceratobasidium theobromae]